MPTHQEQGEQDYHIHYYIISDIGTSDGEFLEDQIVSIFQVIITADSYQGATEYAEDNKRGASYRFGSDPIQVAVTPLANYLDNLREAKDELENLTAEAAADDDEEEDAE